MTHLLKTRWISESTELWHVACPGPSLNFDAIPDDGQPVICINVAIKVATRCDFWCCWDSPNEIHEAGWPKVWELRPGLVTGVYGACKEWLKLMRESKQWTYDRWVSVTPNAKPWGPPWYVGAVKGGHFSTFNAIGWALLRGGAREIRLYGCDMGGKGYYDAKTSRLRKAQKSDERWRKRWEKENRIYETICKAADKEGIKICRLLPDGTWDR